MDVLIELKMQKCEKVKFLLILEQEVDVYLLLIKKKLPHVEVFAIDVSEKALEVARKNAVEQDVKINFQNLIFSMKLRGINYQLLILSLVILLI